MYLPIPISIIFISCIYLILRKNTNMLESNFFINKETFLNNSIILILNIIFVIIFFSTIILLQLDQIYHRSLLYFILITILIATLVLEIISYVN